MDLALLIVRVVIGLGFAAHGAQKLFGMFGGYGLAGTGGWLESEGWKPGKFFAALAGSSELLGGLLLAAGLFGPVGPMFIIATMVSAIPVHAAAGFFAQGGGYELPVAYIGIATLIAFTGAGAYGLDAILGIAPAFTPAVSWIAIGLGVLGGLANVAIRRKPAPAPSTN